MSNKEQGEVEGDNEVEENTEEQDTQEEDFDPKEEIENLKSGLVEEIKELRKEKQEAEAERDLLKNKGKDTEDKEEEIDEVDEKIQKAISAKEKKEAEQTFFNRHKELKEDADSGGVKRSAVEKQLKRFNIDQAETKDEYLSIYEDTYRLARKDDDSSKSSVQNPYASDSNASKPSGGPSESDADLSVREKEVIDRLGWSKEKLMEQKKRRPSYVNRLMNSQY